MQNVTATFGFRPGYSIAVSLWGKFCLAMILLRLWSLRPGYCRMVAGCGWLSNQFLYVR